MDGKEMLQKYVVVEGHRDVYEQLYRTSVGEKSPIRDGINLCVYAISGDSYSHSQNTGRYLETALILGGNYLRVLRTILPEQSVI